MHVVGLLKGRMRLFNSVVVNVKGRADRLIARAGAQYCIAALGKRYQNLVDTDWPDSREGGGLA